MHASDGGLDPETGQGVVTPHFYHAAAAAEVEVDLETGAVRVVDLHVESYAGRVIHPTFAELQCEGNVAFGVGQALVAEALGAHLHEPPLHPERVWTTAGIGTGGVQSPP